MFKANTTTKTKKHNTLTSLITALAEHEDKNSQFGSLSSISL